MQPTVSQYDTAELAAKFKVHRATIMRWAKTGRIPGRVKVSPRCVRFDRQAVDEWYAAGCPDQTAK